MQYLLVEWIHSLSDEPVLLYSEISDDRRELRKIEIFRDGSASFADSVRTTGSTMLSLEALPTLEEIASDPQFRPKLIDRSEFEEAWKRLTPRPSS